MAKKRTARKKVATKLAKLKRTLKRAAAVHANKPAKRIKKNAGADLRAVPRDVDRSTLGAKTKAILGRYSDAAYWSMKPVRGGSSIVSVYDNKKKLIGQHDTANPGRRLRRNPGVEEEAAALAADFHGHEPDVEIEVTTPVFEHTTLSGLGMLKALVIKSANGEHMVTIGFNGTVLARPPRKKDLPQLYLEGGDQSVNLADFGIKPNARHEQEVLGAVHEIIYHTNKTHLMPEDGGKANYGHKFKTTREGDRHVKIKDGRYPIAFYDVRNRLIKLAGGTYDIPAEGIRG